MIDQPAPQFTTAAVFDGGEVRNVSLSDYKGKWVVLFFYVMRQSCGWTFANPTYRAA